MRLYNHYVATSHVTFDIEPYSVETRRPWFDQFSAGTIHQLNVACDGDRLLGYACSSPLRTKRAYDISVETTVYVDPTAQRTGTGRALYGHLLNSLESTKAHGAYALISLPNAASVRLHEALGFKQVGRLTEVGHKFDKLWDVAWFERRIPHAG